MLPPPLQNARDYNGGLAAPVRWLHILWALLTWPIAWATARSRWYWAAPLLIAVVGFLLVYPVDGPVSRWARSLPLGGDVKRELEMLQQFGSLSVAVIVGILIWILDPARCRRLLDLAAAYVVAWLIVQPAKMLIGRPRPKFDDPDYFTGPFGAYPIPGVGVRRPYEVWGDISSDLWSMPSSHTAYAVILAIFIAALYPRLRWFAIVMAIIVGSARVLLGAHWPSDVIVGACVGFAVAWPAVHRYWGTRAVDWAWLRMVDPDATPAYPALRASERERLASERAVRPGEDRDGHSLELKPGAESEPAPSARTRG